MSQSPKLLSQLQEANKPTETLTKAEGSSSFKAGSFFFSPITAHQHLPGLCLQGSGSVMTELGKADGFMTHCLDDTFTKPGLQDSRGRRLGTRKGETCWKLSRLGKMIGRRPLMREVSADIHFQAVALLKGRDFRDPDPLGVRGGGNLLTLVFPACIAMRKSLDSSEPQFPH